MSFQGTRPDFTAIQDTYIILCTVIVTFCDIRYSELNVGAEFQNFIRFSNIPVKKKNRFPLLSLLKTLEGPRPFEMSRTTRPTTRRHIPQDRIPQQHRCRTLTFQNFDLFFSLTNIKNFANFDGCTGYGLLLRHRPASKGQTRHVTNERQKLETTTSSAHLHFFTSTINSNARTTIFKTTVLRRYCHL